jgi:DNA-binding NarL/FixJ family response regulator
VPPNTPKDPISVFLCDDVPEFRALMRLALEDDPSLEVVGEADDGRTCVDCVSQDAPDVILLDLSMPNWDGLEAIPLIRQSAPQTAIVVLSSHSKARMGAKAMAAGATAYVEKGSSFAEIRSAVRAAAA